VLFNYYNVFLHTEQVKSFFYRFCKSIEKKYEKLVLNSKILVFFISFLSAISESVLTLKPSYSNFVNIRQFLDVFVIYY